MRTELRPLKLGEILDRIFQMYRAYPLMFMGMAAVGAVIGLVVRAFYTFAERGLQPHETALHLQWLTAAGSVLIGGVQLIAYSLVLGAMVHCVAAIYLERPVGAELMLRKTLPQWFRLAAVTVAVFLMAWGLFFAVLLVIGVAAVAVNGTGQRALIGSLIAAAGGLSFLVLVPLGLWLSVRYSLANAACAYEGATVGQSMKRSVELTQDLKWRLLVLLIVVGLIQILVSILLNVPIYFSIFKHLRHPPLWVVMYTLLTTFVASVITTPVGGIGIALFYFDARARKEGLDVEWSMQDGPSVEQQPGVFQYTDPGSTSIG